MERLYLGLSHTEMMRYGIQSKTTLAMSMLAMASTVYSQRFLNVWRVSLVDKKAQSNYTIGDVPSAANVTKVSHLSSQTYGE